VLRSPTTKEWNPQLAVRNKWSLTTSECRPASATASTASILAEEQASFAPILANEAGIPRSPFNQDGFTREEGREEGGEGEREFTPLIGAALITSIAGQIAVGLALVVLLIALLRRRTVAERRVSYAKLARAELGQATMWPEGP